MKRISGSFRSFNCLTYPASLLFFILFVFASGMLTGCSTLSNGRTWGQDATWNPGWDRLREATVSAVKSPRTWGPLAAALVLQIDDMDERVSDWASDNTPIFVTGTGTNLKISKLH